MTKHGYGRTGKRPGPVTSDPTAPAMLGPFVSSVTPINGSTDRQITVNAVVTFGRAMLASSITTATFTLTGPSGVVAAAVSFDSSTMQATLNPTGDLANGATYTGRIKGGSSGVIDATGSLMAADYVWTFTTIAAVVVPSIVGYGYTTTGGEGGTVFTAATWAQLKTALLDTRPRIIKMAPSAGVIDGGGEELTVWDGDLTIDGTGWNGILRNYKIIIRASNIIIREMAMRNSEGATATLSADRRAFTFNPPTGGTIRRVLLDKCSFAWGADVVGSLLSDCADVTYQYCVFGPALYASNIVTSPNGYGVNILNINGLSSRITYYRNLMIMNYRRNIQGYQTDGWDVVNNVIYDFGYLGANGNPRFANIVGNIFKKGPETIGTWKDWFGEVNQGSGYLTFNQDSVYYPIAGADRNIGMLANGNSYTLVTEFAAGTQRTTPYLGGPTDSRHGPGVTVTTPNQALFEAVVAGAGRTYQDPMDTLIKAHALAGTSNGYYNGPSTGTPPYPTYNLT